MKGIVMAVEAVKSYSVGFQQPHKTNLKSQQSFTSAPEVDEEKSNAVKYMIGATALAAVVGLGIAGYKGKLGKGVQKLLGGAESAAEKAVESDASKAGNETPKIKPEELNEESRKVYLDIKQKLDGKITCNVNDKKSNELNELGQYYHAQEMKMNNNIDALIAKKNEEMMRSGVDGKVFRDKNNPEHIIEIIKTKDGYSKTISSIENLLNGEDTFIETTYKHGNSLEKIYANGAIKEIKRSLNSNGRYVSTNIYSPDLEYSYLKGANYNENGKLINSSEYVQTSDMLTACNSEQPGFTEVKKEVFERLHKGLDWQE